MFGLLSAKALLRHILENAMFPMDIEKFPENVLESKRLPVSQVPGAGQPGAIPEVTDTGPHDVPVSEVDVAGEST